MSKVAHSLEEFLSDPDSFKEINFERQSIELPNLTILAEVLQSNNSVTHINLRNNNIGSEGMIALAETLRVNNSITHINLCDNKIGIKGANALFEALQINNSVIYINLEGRQDDIKKPDNLPYFVMCNTGVYHQTLPYYLAENAVNPYHSYAYSNWKKTKVSYDSKLKKVIDKIEELTLSNKNHLDRTRVENEILETQQSEDLTCGYSDTLLGNDTVDNYTT